MCTIKPIWYVYLFGFFLIWGNIDLERKTEFTWRPPAPCWSMVKYARTRHITFPDVCYLSQRYTCTLTCFSPLLNVSFICAWNKWKSRMWSKTADTRYMRVSALLFLWFFDGGGFHKVVSAKRLRAQRKLGHLVLVKDKQAFGFSLVNQLYAWVKSVSYIIKAVWVFS